MPWSRCMSHVVIATTHYTVFVLPQLASSLFVSPNKHSVWLCLCQAMDQNQRCEADVDGVSHVENGHKKSGVFELGHSWIQSKILSLDRRRISLQENRPLPFHGAEESQEKKSRSDPDVEVDHARPRRTMNTAQSSAVFMSMDTRGYIDKSLVKDAGSCATWRQTELGGQDERDPPESSAVSRTPFSPSTSDSSSFDHILHVSCDTWNLLRSSAWSGHTRFHTGRPLRRVLQLLSNCSLAAATISKAISRKSNGPPWTPYGYQALTLTAGKRAHLGSASGLCRHFPRV